METLRIAFISALVLELMAMIGTGLVAAVVGVQLAGGSLGFQAGLTVLILAPELYQPFRQVGVQYHAAADGVAAAETIFDVLDRPAAVTTPTDPVTPPSPAAAHRCRPTSPPVTPAAPKWPIPPTGGTAIPSRIAPTAGHATRSSPTCHTTGQRRRCGRSRCARPARRSTTTRPVAGFMPSPTPARRAGQRCGSAAATPWPSSGRRRGWWAMPRSRRPAICSAPAGFSR